MIFYKLKKNSNIYGASIKRSAVFSKSVELKCENIAFALATVAVTPFLKAAPSIKFLNKIFLFKINEKKN